MQALLCISCLKWIEITGGLISFGVCDRTPPLLGKYSGQLFIFKVNLSFNISVGKERKLTCLDVSGN